MCFDLNEVPPVSYDPSGMAQNGVTTQHMLPAALTQYGRHYGAQTMQSYSLPGSPWLPQYVMQPAPHMTQVEVSNIKVLCAYRPSFTGLIYIALVYVSVPLRMDAVSKMTETVVTDHLISGFFQVFSVLQDR